MLTATKGKFHSQLIKQKVTNLIDRTFAMFASGEVTTVKKEVSVSGIIHSLQTLSLVQLGSD